jgi:glycosyltransferase involved in cell wall biosynthesis
LNAEVTVGPGPKGRRLAVVDTRFPWKLSGFRYWEAVEILRQRPDTLFFALQRGPDEFPTEVHDGPLFRELALREGITDVYCVFLNLAASLLGLTRLPTGEPVPGCWPYVGLADLFESGALRLHATLYPGGGLDPSTPRDFITDVGRRCATVFSSIEEVLDTVPGAIYVSGIVNTVLYEWSTRAPTESLGIVFSHYRGDRKNFPVMARAFNALGEGFHLHLVGNWEDELSLLTNPRYTFHGLLPPESVRDVYSIADVFVSCSSADQFAFEGFPTTSAVDAMATGCLLVTTNARKDYRALRPDADYVDVPVGDANALARALRWVRGNPAQALRIAMQGTESVRRRFDCRTVVAAKLAAMNASVPTDMIRG